MLYPRKKDKILELLNPEDFKLSKAGNFSFYLKDLFSIYIDHQLDEDSFDVTLPKRIETGGTEYPFIEYFNHQIALRCIEAENYEEAEKYTDSIFIADSLSMLTHAYAEKQEFEKAEFFAGKDQELCTDTVGRAYLKAWQADPKTEHADALRELLKDSTLPLSIRARILYALGDDLAEIEKDPRDSHKILAYLELARVSKESSFVNHAKQLASQIDRDTHNLIIAEAFLKHKEVALAFDLVKNSPVDCADLFVIYYKESKAVPEGLFKGLDEVIESKLRLEIAKALKNKRMFEGALEILNPMFQR